MYKDFTASMVSSLSHLKGCTNWSTLAVTENKVLGRAPHGSQPGDVVALFAGAKLPFIVRRRPQGTAALQIVGPCYMHGIMEGELAHLITENNLTDFVLS